jgi:hypothetical protein
MRTTIFAIATATSIVAAVMPAHVQERTALPEITVGAPPKNGAPSDASRAGAGPTSAGPTGAGPINAGHTRCGTATSGGDLGCLNETLKKQVDQVNPVLNAPPIDAKSQDLKVGTVNIPAVQQQYGQNFGHSVIPFRPSPPVFTSPVGRR